MSFQSLGLADELLKSITEQGYTEPTPIQQQAIPLILQGRDMLAGAQTGTGKTAGFTLPMLQLLAGAKVAPGEFRPVRGLVLTPTRELAAQVYESVRTYGKHMPLFVQAVFGGVSINNQIRVLQKGCDIVVATPGRLLDLVNQKHIDLTQVRILVLDEADRMLDMGFLPDIRKILERLPKKRQTLLFSATYSNEIKTLAATVLRDPVSVEVARQNVTADKIAERVYGIARDQKRELLSYLVGSGNWQQVLVFVRTKHGADRLAKQLQTDGIRTAALHGDKTQGARNKALESFKTGQISVLVATDIAARGLDIDQLPHVVNFDLPQVAEDYVHRIGRTGRAGASGEAISLVCPEEASLLADIEKLLKRQITRVADTGYEPVSLKVMDAPKKQAANKTTGKKDFRNQNKTTAPKTSNPRGKPPAKPAAGGPSRRKPKARSA
ncbi:MAG: ATP-dependent RNA helicase RhlE [Methylobacter sp.]|nr:MAG: ATP-dependent RNA helicase RhlE [Methylobacter sp.]PPD24472.1 MAG: ATP-dependent RNA helicase RhlE [Methylobacter sp.]